MGEKTNLSQIYLQMANEVEDIIQCPVCLDTSVNVVQCTVGHHVCDKCRLKLDKCPTCKNPFSNAKCFMIEELSNIMNKMRVSVHMMDKNMSTENKVKKYRTSFKTLLEKLSLFLNNQSDTLLSLSRYMKNSSTSDGHEIEKQLTSLTKDIKNIQVFMKEIEKTLTEIKKM